MFLSLGDTSSQESLETAINNNSRVLKNNKSNISIEDYLSATQGIRKAEDKDKVFYSLPINVIERVTYG
jgi:prephenate dehydrogenase